MKLRIADGERSGATDRLRELYFVDSEHAFGTALVQFRHADDGTPGNQRHGEDHRLAVKTHGCVRELAEARIPSSEHQRRPRVERHPQGLPLFQPKGAAHQALVHLAVHAHHSRSFVERQNVAVGHVERRAQPAGDGSQDPLQIERRRYLRPGLVDYRQLTCLFGQLTVALAQMLEELGVVDRRRRLFAEGGRQLPLLLAEMPLFLHLGDEQDADRLVVEDQRHAEARLLAPALHGPA